MYVQSNFLGLTLSARADIEDGYKGEWCVVCQNKVQTIQQFISVKQIRDCSSSLSINPDQSEKVKIQYSSEGSTQILPVTTLFLNEHSEECPITRCYLMDPQSPSLYDGDFLSIIDDNLTAKNDYEDGVTESVNVVCTNGPQTYTFSNLEVEQVRDCSTSLILTGLTWGPISSWPKQPISDSITH